MSIAAPENSCLFPHPETHSPVAALVCREGCSGHRKVTIAFSLLASSPCQEILLWFLEKSEREVSLAVLEGFAGLNSSVHALHPQCRFRAGSEGGATIAVEETIR